MSTEDNKAIVARFVDAFLRRDAAGLRETASPELAIAALGRWIPGNDAIWGEKTITITAMMAEGDEVWARLTETARHIGDWQGLPPTDRVTTFAGILFLRLSGGKVVALNALWDELGRVKQLGGVVTPAGK